MSITSQLYEIEALTPHPQNYNEHPDQQLAALSEGLGQFSQYKNIVVWSSDREIDLGDGRKLYADQKYILAGHGLWLAMRRRGETHIEAKDMTGLPYEEALALLEWDNASTHGARPNPELLAKIQERTKGLLADRPNMAWALRAHRQAAGVSENGHKGEEQGPQVDKAAELQEKWGTQTGQVWQLGEHRLAVGDCTDKAVVESVMRGERAECLCTDPPYAFGLSSTSQMATKSGGWHDMMNNASWFTDRFRQWSTIIKSGPIWTFCNWRTLPILMRAGFDSKIGIYSVMVWYKDWIGPGGQQGLRPTYELITLTTLGDYAIPNRGIEDFISIPWSSHKPTGHRAEKPVDLIIHLLKISEANLTLDPFLGSGTTIIACEQLKRKCRAIEIDPGYCAVTLQRWADLTGGQPELIEG